MTFNNNLSTLCGQVHRSEPPQSRYFPSVGKKVLGLGSHRIAVLVVPRGLPDRWQWILCSSMLQSNRPNRSKITSLSMQNHRKSLGRLYTITQTHCTQQVKYNVMYHPVASVQAHGQRASRTRTQRLPASQCSHFTSIGSFGACSGTKSIATDPVKPVGPLETRSGEIRGS